MENMVNLFGNIYAGKKVLITGHTGFKGSWLSLWLHQLGAEVVGYSKEIPTQPSHFELLDLPIETITGDVRDGEKLKEVVAKHRPDLVFHLAAQPLVRLSYNKPVETYETNVIGSLKLYEACRASEIKAIVSITTDKVYHNQEWLWGYRENDPLGGYDPYSSSKGCMELMTDSYRNSYFNLSKYKESHQTLLATARAGNVIGGGDWAEDRLIPDLVRGVVKGEAAIIRSPQSVRPWQHVLEPLYGYLLLGEQLLRENTSFAEAWNFGPLQRANITVGAICEVFKKEWPAFSYIVDTNQVQEMHETNFLQLDSTKSFTRLNWQPQWDDDPFSQTINWYYQFSTENKVISKSQLKAYTNSFSQKKQTVVAE